MTTTLIVLACVLAWVAVGHPAAKRAAHRAFRTTRSRYDILCRNDPRFGQGEATFAYICWLLLGPVGFLLSIGMAAAYRSIPELVEADAADKRAELARLNQQIDEAHRTLGIAPLKRDIA